MLLALGRMIWLPIAFVVSGMVAAMVLLTLGLERITGAAHTDDTTWLVAMFEIVRHAPLLASGIPLVPALLVVIVGEVARIRSALYYILGGGVALAVLPLFARFGNSGATPTIVWQVFASAGFAGGALYWLLAGRRA